MRSLKSLLALSCLALITCAVAGAQSLSEPERNFEALWKTFDEKYFHFGVKNIDWQAVYRIYRPKVTAKTTDDELFDVLATMIAHLNDNHVGLRSPSRRFGAGILQELRMEDFSLDLVKEKYLKGKALPLHDGVFHYQHQRRYRRQARSRARARHRPHRIRGQARARLTRGCAEIACDVSLCAGMRSNPYSTSSQARDLDHNRSQMSLGRPGVAPGIRD